MDWDNQQYKDASLFKLMQKLNVIPIETPISFLQTDMLILKHTRKGMGPRRANKQSLEKVIIKLEESLNIVFLDSYNNQDHVLLTQEHIINRTKQLTQR